MSIRSDKSGGGAGAPRNRLAETIPAKRDSRISGPAGVLQSSMGGTLKMKKIGTEGSGSKLRFGNSLKPDNNLDKSMKSNSDRKSASARSGRESPRSKGAASPRGSPRKDSEADQVAKKLEGMMSPSKDQVMHDESGDPQS